MKKLVYLISPNKINDKFYLNLDKVLSHKNVSFFQLRLKKIKNNSLLKIINKIKKITSKYKVKLIINDNFILASRVKADGCHMGQQDGSFEIARSKLKNKILGITCHNSKKLAQFEYLNLCVICHSLSQGWTVLKPEVLWCGACSPGRGPASS